MIRAIPTAHAMKLALTGDRIDAEEAYRLGIVNKISKDKDVVGAAMQFVESFDKAAPLALSQAKRVIHKASGGSTEEAHDLAADTFVDLWFTEDHREAEKAFAEKRGPVFKGK